MRTLLQLDYGKYLLLPVDCAGSVLEALTKAVIIKRDTSKFPFFVPVDDGSTVELIFTTDENIASSMGGVNVEAIERQVIQALSMVKVVSANFNTTFPDEVPNEKEDKQNGSEDLPS